MTQFKLGCYVTFVLLCIMNVAKSQETIDELKRRVTTLESRMELLEQLIDSLVAQNAKGKRMESSPAAPALKEAADPFRVGVVWVGEAKSGDKVAKWALSVSGREGNRLTAGVVVALPNGEKQEFGLAGTAPGSGDGLVVLESELVGRAKIFARGRLQNGEIALTFSGTSKLGDKMFGSATLRPKN